MLENVKFGVIPCAGKGTRFLPITKSVSKEMLNIIDRPTIDYIVDELIDSGIKDIVFVVSPSKTDIKKYYSKDESLINELKESHKEEYIKEIEKLTSKANFYYVTQKEALGLGHAVLMAKEIVHNNNFVVCCGDDITLYDKCNPPIKSLIEAFNLTHSTIVGGQKVEHSLINKYGSMDIENNIDETLFKLKGIVEKPSLDKAPSDYASLGKWVFKPNIFNELEHTKKGLGNEIQLTDAIESLIKKEDVYFKIFNGKRYDCGDKLGFLKAIIDISLTRGDIKDGFLKYIKSIIK